MEPTKRSRRILGLSCTGASRLMLSVLLLIALSPEAWSADRSIRFIGIEDELRTNVEANVSLSRLARDQKLSSLSEPEWNRLRRAVRSEIREALEPYGYYRVEIQPEHSESALVYRIDLGEPVRIGQLSIQINGAASGLDEFEEWRNSISFAAGDILLQTDYESAKDRLLALASRLGFFDAQLEQHEILISEDRTTADIALVMNSGARYNFGTATVRWDQSEALLRDSVLEPHYKFAAGKPYDADLLASTRGGLQSTPYFSRVEVKPNLESSVEQSVPIDVVLGASKRHTFNFALGAGTDTGVRASVGYENRRLNTRGHHLSARIGASDIRETAILNYRIPLSSSARDSLNFLLSREEENNDFRTFAVSKLGAELARQWRDSTVNFAVTASRETFLVGTDEFTTDLVLPSVGVEKIVSNDPYFPTFGWSADITLRGADESLGSDTDLIQLIADGKAVVSVGEGRFLARLRAAGTRIDDAQDLPASLGFLTGGDRTVRGYRYESIGVPIDAEDGRGIAASSSDQQLTVGRHLLAASLEYEHPLKNQFAVAAFVDVGDAFNRSLDLKRGVGVGLRWRLPFGSLKADVASALDRDGTPLRLHLSFGSDL